MPDLNKILHVDDDPDIQEIVLMVLESLGDFTVKQCGSGREALEAVEDFEPDLFLFDVMMPEISGTELLSQIREQPCFSRTPVIFMTAKAQTAENHEFLEFESCDVIAKPFDPMALVDQIRASWKKITLN